MSIDNKTKVAVGVVPTHLKFVGSLVPDENGKLPRTRSGILKVVSGTVSYTHLTLPTNREV